MFEIHQKIYQKILTSSKILLVAHERPDMDALGSLCAMARFLEKLKITYQAYCDQSRHDLIPFLTKGVLISSAKNFNFYNFDLIIAFDCGNLERTKLSKEISRLHSNQYFINFDHHPKTDNFANLEIKNPQASSTCELIYDFFIANSIKLDEQIAENILAGILADTGNFLFPSTSAKVIKIAAHLINQGANWSKITKNIYQERSWEELKVQGLALERFRINPKYNFGYTFLLSEEIDKCGEDKIKDLPNFLASLNKVKGIIFLREMKNGFIRVNLRSNQFGTDVSLFANICGGGGHQKTASFIVKGKLEINNNQVRVI